MEKSPIGTHREIRTMDVILHLERLPALSFFPAPSGGPGWEPETLQQQAQRTVENALVEIKRHLHDLPIVGNPEWHIAVSDFCDLCGREWEEDGDGSPLCCQRAYDSWAQRAGAPATK